MNAARYYCLLVLALFFAQIANVRIFQSER